MKESIKKIKSFCIVIKSNLKKLNYFKIKKITELLFVSYWLYKLNVLKKNESLSKLKVGFKFQILSKKELYYFVEINYINRYIELYKKRLESSNYKCFAIIEINTNKLVYYSWINFSKSHYCKEINKTLKLMSKNTCLFEDDNTLIEYRNNGFHKFVMEKRINYCIENNIDTIYILIHIFNKPALNTVKKYNFRRKNIPLALRDGSFNYILKKING
jgi:hypothetical protein